MKESTTENSRILCTLDADEQTAIFASHDCHIVTCMGRGLYRFMKDLILYIRKGRIGGTLILCRISIGKESGIHVGNIQRLLLPFRDISDAHWVITERRNNFIFVEYVFKNYEKNDRRKSPTPPGMG